MNTCAGCFFFKEDLKYTEVYAKLSGRCTSEDRSNAVLLKYADELIVAEEYGCIYFQPMQLQLPLTKGVVK